MRLHQGLLRHAETLLGELLTLASAADQTVARYFRRHHQLGQSDRAFVAETVYAVLRRRRSLEHAAGSATPRSLVLAALVRVLGFPSQVLEGVLRDDEPQFVERLNSTAHETMPPEVQAELPDWLWQRLVTEQGEGDAIAQGLLGTAPLDLRVNLARIGRQAALERLYETGIAAAPTPFSPAGLRIEGSPAVKRHKLFEEGLIDVQDEGSQLLAYLVAPRRGEMVGDFCAGAGGKTLALAMLMRGAGRVYAMDVSAKRLHALAPRAARAGLANVHPLALSGENDARAKRLGGKLDRVLVDAPCSGFGTLRRNPDLKWRHGPEAVSEFAARQLRILASAARLLKPGGRLVYATCSILVEENEAVVQRFADAHPQFAPLSCGELLAAQRIPLEAGAQLRLWPHRHATDGFFAAAFEHRQC